MKWNASIILLKVHKSPYLCGLKAPPTRVADVGKMFGGVAGSPHLKYLNVIGLYLAGLFCGIIKITRGGG
jgi:hypothetical protein